MQIDTDIGTDTDADSCQSSNAYCMPGRVLVTYVNGLTDICRTPLTHQALGLGSRQVRARKTNMALVLKELIV